MFSAVEASDCYLLR